LGASPRLSLTAIDFAQKQRGQDVIFSFEVDSTDFNAEKNYGVMLRKFCEKCFRPKVWRN
jgi:hypothetical protein